MLTINRQLYGFYYFMFPYYSYYGWYYYSNPDSPPLPHRAPPPHRPHRPIRPPVLPQPPENKQRRRNQNRLQCTVNIYALGPEKVISKQVKDQLKSYGKVTRISGNTPETNSIAFAKYKDQTTQFGWGITQPGHGLAFNRLNKVDSAIRSAAE